MALGHRVLRAVHVVAARVAGQIRKPRGQQLHEPRRRLPMPDVDGEIQHAGRGGLIAVIARRQANRRARLQIRHQLNISVRRHTVTPPWAIKDNGRVTGTGAGATELVIFDLDGTLTDSAEGIVASFVHALSHIGAAVPEGDLACQIVGPPMDETFRSLGLGEHTEAAIAAFRAEYGARGWAVN